MNRTAPMTIDQWRALSHRGRCRIVSRVRHEIAENCDELATLCRSAQRQDLVDTVSGELIPLCAALKSLRHRGPRILRTRRHGIIGRPVWLWGVRSETQRVARGDVLILAAWNYPILLPGVQMAQAIAAGNRVFLKPAPGCEAVTRRLVELYLQAGVPACTLELLDSSTQAAIDRIDQGVNLVVLTGASSTGRAVMRRCAEKLTPTILELSGNDAVIVGPGADLKKVAQAIRFGLMFNSGATCIGPRRLIVAEALKTPLAEYLRQEFADCEAVNVHPAAFASVTRAVDETLKRGATNLIAGAHTSGVSPNDSSSPPQKLPPTIFGDVRADWPIANSDLFAPVASMITYRDDAEAIEMVNRCAYRLAASVFGSTRWASSIAERLDVGTVTINDLIFPTADPRLSFGGRGESGFGVTRGDEGLLQMTVPKVIAKHRGRLYLHLAKRKPGDLDTLAGALTLTHGRLRQKALALRRIFAGVKFNGSRRTPAD